MDAYNLSDLLKVITWAGGVCISIWIIKLLREINSKQKEYILLIEKAFQEREKTRDQKIELLDTTHKKEIELIEREKSIFFKSMESEKKNLELQLSVNPSSNNDLLNNLIIDLKNDLSLVVNKISNLSVQSKDLNEMKNIVGIAGDINRTVNFIYNEESNSEIKGDFNTKENILLQDFILEIFNSIYEKTSFMLEFSGSFSDFKPVFISKQVLYIIVTEILMNVQRHTTSNIVKISGFQNLEFTEVNFENQTDAPYGDIAMLAEARIADNNYFPGGLYLIKDIMRRSGNDVKFEHANGLFRVSLVFK